MNEKISEADKARIDFSKILHPSHRQPLIPNEWTVDRERDIALIPFGTVGRLEMDRDGIEKKRNVFVLYWQGQLINVRLKKSFIGDRENGSEITWELDICSVPADLARDEILLRLNEALSVYGSHGALTRDSVKAVHIKF